MNAMEKRARELLAAEYEREPLRNSDLAKQIRQGVTHNATWHALAALRKALAPPEGYVLVQVDQDSVDFYICDACGHHYMQDGVNCDCIPSSTARPLRHVRMIAARPEMQNVND